MSQRRASRQGVAADHARLSRRRRNALVTTLLRTGSVHAREILAEQAWPGHTPADLEAWAGASPVSLPAGLDPVALADMARVWSLQPDLEGRTRTDLGRAGLEAVYRHRRAALGIPHLELLTQLRLIDGEFKDALDLVADRRVRPDVGRAVLADSLNPHLAPGSDLVAWAAAFSDALHSTALAPVLPPADGLPDFDLLQVQETTAVRPSGLVTVIMSAYQPGAALLTAVGSVLAQTWPELELLVVDDHSSPTGAGEEFLARAEAMDPRVRVIRKALNGGTYRARNTALRQARGDFFTVIDSDDRWHPQTLEVCLAPLLADRGLLATRAEGVRVPQDLRVTRLGYRPRFVSAATVVFRRAEVMGRIGFFDPTSKGADTEFARRLEASCGPVIHDLAETTTMLRAGDSTLSAGEFRAGWRHPSRHLYKSLYGGWHDQIRAGESSPHLDPSIARIVPEPLRWERAEATEVRHRRAFDLCVAGDWRRFGGPQRSMVEEILAAREAGLSVAVMHLEAFRFMSSQDLPVTSELADLVRSGLVSWVLPDDDVEIGVLMIRYPPILQYPPAVKDPVRARHVLVMANQAPIELDGTDQRYVVADVTERTRALFGAPVTWVPQSRWMRRILLEQDPEVELTDWDNPGIIDVDAWDVRRRPGVTDPAHVVVGRHSRDDRIKFPRTWEEMVEGYSLPPGSELRILGGERTVTALLAEGGEEAALPANWTLLPHGSQDVREFLAGLDFYLYLDNDRAHESFGRTLLEAAASGVLTIAHPKHRVTFGPVLDYADPGEAQGLIEHYRRDPEAYAERVRQTRAEVRRRYSGRRFISHLVALLPPDPARPRPDHTSSPASISLGLRQPGLLDGPEVWCDGAEVLTVPLRSSADAESPDFFSVVHAGVATALLHTWLRDTLAGHASDTWNLGDGLKSAPHGVWAVVDRRDGQLSAWGRGQWAGQDPQPPHGGWARLDPDRRTSRITLIVDAPQ